MNGPATRRRAMDFEEKVTNPQTTNNIQIPMTKEIFVIWILVLGIVCDLEFVYWNLNHA